MQCGFCFFRLTADIITLFTVRVCRVLDNARAFAFDVSKAFDRVWHADFSSLELLSYRWNVLQIFDLIQSVLANRKL